MFGPIAATNKYKYTIWNDQVLIVDPAKNTVDDILHDYILHDYDKPANHHRGNDKR